MFPSLKNSLGISNVTFHLEGVRKLLALRIQEKHDFRNDFINACAIVYVEE